MFMNPTGNECACAIIGKVIFKSSSVSNESMVLALFVSDLLS